MEQMFLNDNGGRRSGLERRDLATSVILQSERRSGQDRRIGIERRLRIKLASRSLKDLGRVKFESPSKISKLKK